MNQSHIDSRTRQSPPSLEAAVLAARKNRDAAIKLLEMYPDRPALVARAIASRDKFEAEIESLKCGGPCQP